MAEETKTAPAKGANEKEDKKAVKPPATGLTRHQKDVEEHAAHKAATDARKKQKEKQAKDTKEEDRPLVEPQSFETTVPVSPVYEAVERGRLGDGGPSSNEKGENIGNFKHEEDQHPSMNATAGGPDVGMTPANSPGLSHA